MWLIIINAVKYIVTKQEEIMSRKGENIYKKKDGRWEGRYKKGVDVNGRTLYGSCYAKSYREVKAKSEICKQKSNLFQQNRNKKKLFGAYCDEWLNINKNKVKESTVAKYSSALENHIKPYFGGLLPEVITTEMTAAFVEEILHTKKLSAKTAKEFSGIY